MSTLDLSKDSKRKPIEVVSDVALSDDAVALLPQANNTLGYLNNLCDQELYHDAFVTLARTLPKQYAIIWASRCVEEALGKDLEALDKRCLDLAKQWLSNPDDKIRRAAMDAADAREYEGACAWLAAAVGFSGGSLAPENQAEVAPPHHLTAVAVAACLIALSVRDPERAGEFSKHMVEQGLAMVAIPSSSDKGN